MRDHEFMGQALSLAQQGKGFTSPNPCVGAVVVREGQVVGKGFHHGAGLAHAEVEAIEDAGGQTHGATIYVTLEPCNHFGKTPPCTHKILDSGITRVVVGCMDPNPYVGGGGIAFLREKGIAVECGVLQEQAKVLIEDFIWYTRHEKTPFVILKCAATLDGFIATSTGDSQWITNPQSRAQGHRLRHEVDAILIGSGTLHADNPSLTARIDGRETRDPARIILDTRLTISENARVVTQESTAPTIIVCGPNPLQSKKNRLLAAGVQVLEVGLRNQRLDLNELMIKLGKMSVMSLLIEGGGQVSASALKQGIVNKVCYFMAPKIMGGSDGKPVFNGPGPERIAKAIELKDVSMKSFDTDILVQGYIRR